MGTSPSHVTMGALWVQGQTAPGPWMRPKMVEGPDLVLADVHQFYGRQGGRGRLRPRARPHLPRPPPGQMCFPAPFAAQKNSLLTGTRARWERRQIPRPSCPGMSPHASSPPREVGSLLPFSSSNKLPSSTIAHEINGDKRLRFAQPRLKSCYPNSSAQVKLGASDLHRGFCRTLISSEVCEIPLCISNSGDV